VNNGKIRALNITDAPTLHFLKSFKLSCDAGIKRSVSDLNRTVDGNHPIVKVNAPRELYVRL